jgi:hypothetical protein
LIRFPFGFDVGEEHFCVDVSLESFDQVVHHGELDRSGWPGTEIESEAKEGAELGRRSKVRTEIMAGHFRRAV